MRVLIVGSDARSHALAWTIARQRPEVELLLAPGNDGSVLLGERAALEAGDFGGLISLARDRSVDLTVVSPEVPLANGIADAFAEAGLRLFGPSRLGAQIEASKAWAKGFMQRHGIPTARFYACSTVTEADEAIRSFRTPPVIKDDALAAGKGVVVPTTFDEAARAANAVLERPGGRVVVEERLEGWETSGMAFCDGSSFVMLPPSCDYKRVGDGDTGPNTGGMGAYAPAALSPDLLARIEHEIVGPAVRGMAAEGRPFVGTLYPGLMITRDGPKVIEFNCRLGDPEAQALLPLLASDLLEVFQACVEGSVAGMRVQWAPGACCAVVLASPGYPDAPVVAEVGGGWRSLTDGLAFRAGNSGRVMTVSATGADLADARARAYAAVEQARFPGAVFRTDIARFDRALS